MDQNESPTTSDVEENERMPTPPRSTPPRPIPLTSTPPTSIPLSSTPPRSSRTRSRSPRSSRTRSRSPRSSRTRSRSPISSPLRSTTPRSSRTRSRSPRSSPARSSPARSRSPRSSPARSRSPRSSPARSRSPRSSPARSISPRSNPARSRSPRSSPQRLSRTRSRSPISTPPRSTRLRLTPVRLARLKSIPVRLTPTKSTRPKSTRRRSTRPTSTPPSSGEMSSPTPAVSTAKSSPSPLKRPRSKTSTSGPANKRCKSWDPLTDFEIERIVGYHRDNWEQMWYFVKWKGWSEKFNTFEPIENMTGCNYMLMKHFEYKKPSDAIIAAKDNEILESLESYEVYLKLKESNFKKEDLDEFSETCVDISQMFKKGSFIAFSKKIQREYGYIIRCLIGMCSHQDQGLIRRAQNYKIVLKMIKIRRKQLRENLAIQNHINTLESTEIKIENYSDLDIFPKELTYVVDLKPGNGIEIPSDPTVGCDCEKGCSARSHCCGEMASTVFAYNRYRRVRSLERFAIYECNRRCKCPPECPNRVVQHGMKIKLCIFKTESCGWGVKTLEKIPKGAFICEYVGELISEGEAVVRDIEYYKKNSSYVFDLDFSPDHDTNMYCIDATKYGNLARFINHSCDPNLVVYPVWIDCLVPSLHRLAFFARRNIKKDEELCIDYENAQDGHVPTLSKEEEEKKNQRTLRTLSRIRCQCGAQGCREWVFGN